MTKAEFLEACRSARAITNQDGDPVLLIGEVAIDCGNYADWIADALRLAPLQVVKKSAVSSILGQVGS